MKAHILSIIASPVLALVSCGPMTSDFYGASQADLRAAYPRLKTVYRNGQTPGQIRDSIKKAGIRPMLSDETAHRPAGGWEPGSWEFLHGQANRLEVARVDRFAFGGFTSYGAAMVYFHRVFYDGEGRSVGWYVTHD